MSSIVTFQGVLRSANHATSKAYVLLFREALADELVSQCVAVLRVRPGSTSSGSATRAQMILGKTIHSTVVAHETLAALDRAFQVTPGALSRLLLASLMMAPPQPPRQNCESHHALDDLSDSRKNEAQ